MRIKNVLIISFAYPPRNSIGSTRISKMSKSLADNGYNPIIITAPKGNSEDDSPIEIPEKNIHRVEFFDIWILINYLCKRELIFIRFLGKILKYFIPFGSNRMPERRLFFWRKSAYKTACAIIATNNIDFIYSSSSPPGTAIIASKLSEKYSIPWVVEFRDLWTKNPYDTRNRVHQYLEEKYEKKIIKNARAIVTVSNPLKEVMEKMHNKPSFIIYNGYDPAEYNFEKLKFGVKFKIIHTGTIYEGKRDPSNLFRALNILENRSFNLLKNTEIEFYGNGLEKILGPLIKKFKVEEYVKIKGRIQRKDILDRQISAAILLLLTWNDEKAKGTLTGKLFEYIGSKRPIIACSYEKGAVNELMSECNIGIVSNDPEQLADFLEDKLVRWDNKDYNLGYDFNSIDTGKYTRENQTKKLIEIFENI